MCNEISRSKQIVTLIILAVFLIGVQFIFTKISMSQENLKLYRAENLLSEYAKKYPTDVQMTAVDATHVLVEAKYYDKDTGTAYWKELETVTIAICDEMIDAYQTRYNRANNFKTQVYNTLNP